jgi:glycosyltransferase involved in cell wall biosynthesis
MPAPAARDDALMSSAPRIGLDLLFLVPGETGGSETYARQLVPALATARGGGEGLVLFVATELAEEWRSRPWVEGATLVTLPVSGRTRVRRTAAEQALLPIAARRARIDLLHALQTVAPGWLPGVASVVTIHDLIYRHHPDSHPGLLAHGMRVLVPLAARRARRIVAISGSVRDDLVAQLGVAAEKIDVVHHGPGLPMDPNPLAPEEVRGRFGLGDGLLVLTPAAQRTHKNVERLLEAMARLDGLEPAPTLALPGYMGPLREQLERRVAGLGLGRRVVFCGWVSDRDLDGLYRAADCLVFPSLAEGFGLPVVEAMRRELPVACADRTSLPEIADGAALLFDPEDVDAIAGATRRLLTDEGLRRDLARRGAERAEQFSWKRAAEGTLGVYERALRG